MQKTISIKTLEKQRAVLMGVAIIFIMLCHSTLAFGDVVDGVYSICKQWLQIGVDIFLFLSGFGCYYSLKKNSSKRTFYWKRICRVLVPYVMVVFVWGLVQPFVQITPGIKSFIYAYSLITFFAKGALDSWYVAAILVLYLLAPLFYKVIEKKSTKYVVASSYAMPVLLLMISLLMKNEDAIRVLEINSEIFLNRIGIFIIGMWFGYKAYSTEKIEIKKESIYLLLIACILLFVLNVEVFPGDKLFFSQWFITRIIFAPMSICVVLLVGNGLSKIKSLKKAGILGWIGGITLEIYLWHEKILMVLDKWLSTLNISTSVISVISNILAVVISVVLAKLFRSNAMIIQNKLLQSGKKEGGYKDETKECRNRFIAYNFHVHDCSSSCFGQRRSFKQCLIFKR